MSLAGRATGRLKRALTIGLALLAAIDEALTLAERLGLQIDRLPALLLSLLRISRPFVLPGLAILLSLNLIHLALRRGLHTALHRRIVRKRVQKYYGYLTYKRAPNPYPAAGKCLRWNATILRLSVEELASLLFIPVRVARFLLQWPNDVTPRPEIIASMCRLFSAPEQDFVSGPDLAHYDRDQLLARLALFEQRKVVERVNTRLQQIESSSLNLPALKALVHWVESTAEKEAGLS
jgi:hypothetical protein